jgi:site-specific DNA recombinase
MRCVLYARVSTDRQADKELSIPAQLLAMRKHVRDRGWEVAEEFVEAGVSARTADRPALRALLSRCRERDSVIGVVLVRKIDRLARSLADHVALKAILRESGIALASVVENLDQIEQRPAGRAHHGVAREFYSANLSEEVKGMRQKVLKGGWPHKPPVG